MQHVIIHRLWINKWSYPHVRFVSNVRFVPVPRDRVLTLLLRLLRLLPFVLFFRLESDFFCRLGPGFCWISLHYVMNPDILFLPTKPGGTVYLVTYKDQLIGVFASLEFAREYAQTTCGNSGNKVVITKENEGVVS